MKQILPLAALCIAAFLLEGCATIVRGSKQSVRIESVPAGATVRLSNGMTGVTPVTFELPRKEGVNVEFRKEGYETVTRGLVSVRSKTGAIASGGNALIGGVIGGAIDQNSGATLDLTPNPLVVTLMPLMPPVDLLPAAPDWQRLKVGMGRRAVRTTLANPAAVSDTTGDQVWSYGDGGSVKFHAFFVESWKGPEETSAAATLQPGAASADSPELAAPAQATPPPAGAAETLVAPPESGAPQS